MIDGWKKKSVGDIADVVTGKTPPTSDRTNYGDHLPFVSPADLGIYKYISKSEKHLSEKGAKKARILPVGTSLFTCIGSTIGKVGLTAVDLTTNQQINAAIPKNGSVNKEYLYYALCDIAPRVKRIAGVQAVPIINKTEFENQIIYLPADIPEQKAIAALLSTWDEAIEKTERLIQAKEKRFKWLLRELISEPRNTQKNTEWKKVKLGDVCKVTTGQSAPQDLSVFTSFGFPFIRVSSLDFLLGKSGSEQTEYISMEKGNELKMTLFQPGTVLFAKSGMSALQPRICKLKKPSFVVSHLCALIPKKSIHEDYLMYYLMKFHPNRLIQGDGFPSIKTSEVSSLKILLPPLEEQKAIAEALTKSQQEIDLLKQLADKYKTQKRGLMQKMLTGEWRVRGFATNDEG